MKTSNSFTPQDSLQLIQQMIANNKQTLYNNSFYFILWGLITAGASITEWFLEFHTSYDKPWIVWPVITTIGGIASGWFGYQQGKKQNTYTFSDKLMGTVWLFSIVAMFVGMFISSRIEMHPNAIVLLIVSIPTFISGGLTKLSIFYFGGAALLLGSIACTMVPFEYLSLTYAASIVAGYIIPGFSLRKYEQNAA